MRSASAAVDKSQTVCLQCQRVKCAKHKYLVKELFYYFKTTASSLWIEGLIFGLF